MPASADEIEIKYEAPAGVSIPDVGALPQVARVEHASAEELEAEYHDSGDLRLLRAGVTLRRRQGGHDAGWHLKVPSGPATRRESHVPLGPSGEPVPPELANQVQVYLRGQPLRPVATLSTTRQRLILRDHAGQSLAEVASDAVRARRLEGTPGTSSAASGSGSSWHEIEVELTGGNRALLDAADELMRRAGLRRSASSAKLGRAFGVQAPTPATGSQLRVSATAGQVVLAYLGAQAGSLAELDPMVRGDQPDAVHQMRVTCRRMRAALQAFGMIIDRSRTGHLIDELRWLGEQLGGARDAEVLSSRLLHDLDTIPTEQLIGPVKARVRGHFAPVGAAAKTALTQVLVSARYFSLLDEIDQLLAEPALTPKAAMSARAALPAAVRSAYRRTSRRMDSARRASGQLERDRALHEARKAAKRARYASEAVAPVIGDARAFAGRMKRIQSLLGEHQDSVIARQVERELAISAHLAGENAFSYGVIFEQEVTRARASERKAMRAWKRARRPRRLRWMN